MKLWPILIALPLVFASPMGAAQVYRWVDADGKVHYTDQPPPPTAKNVQQKKVPVAGTSGAEDASYALRQAKKNFPVTFFVTDCGQGCTQARQLLDKRGIPYGEKNPLQPADAEALKKVTGGKLEVPVLLIGKTVLRGFEESQWHGELDAAGYPRTPPPGARPAQPSQSGPSTPPAPTNQLSPEVVEKFPVTLYTSDCGELCTLAAAYLKRRGIPYAQKNAADPNNVEEMWALSGGKVVIAPILTIGTSVLRGFQEGQWSAALDAAGYPRAPASTAAQPGSR